MRRGNVVSQALALASLAVAIVIATACSSDYGDENHTGERFNACYANGTCNAGLTCIDGLCVVGGDSGASTKVEDAGFESGGGPSDADADAADAADDLKPTIEALCAFTKRCAPSFFKTAYVDDAACVAYSLGNAVPYRGFTALTDGAACAAQVAGMSCIYAGNPLAFGACQPKPGTLPDGTGCNINQQCAGGYCKKVVSASKCGVCAIAKPAGMPCEASRSECATGLDCVNGACQPPKGRGESCKANEICAAGLRCIGTSCQEPRDIGGACSESAQCRVPLNCSPEGKCEEPAYARVDGPCNTATCANAACVGPQDGQTCRAFGKEGAACGDALLPPCGQPFECSEARCVPIIMCP